MKTFQIKFGLLDSFLITAIAFYEFFLYAPLAAKASAQIVRSEFYNHSIMLPKLLNANKELYSTWYMLIGKIAKPNLNNEIVLLASGMLLIGILAAVKGISTYLIVRIRFKAINSFLATILLSTAVAFPPIFYERTSPIFTWFKETYEPDLTATLYLGTLPPNFFVSGTQLISNLFALIAFGYAFLYCRNNKNVTIFQSIALYCLFYLCFLAKPFNIVFIFAGFIPAYLYKTYRSANYSRKKTTLLLSIFCILPLANIYRIYGNWNSGDWMGIKFVAAPFATWSYFSNQIHLDLLSSIVFPLVVTLCVLTTGNRGEKLIQLLVWPSFIASLIIFTLFAESSNGVLVHYGNFIWSAMSANAALYLTSFLAMKDLPKKLKIASLSVLFIQSIFGVYYLYQYNITGQFI